MTIVDYTQRILRQWVLVCAVTVAFVLSALVMVNVAYVKPVPMYGSTAQVLIVESQVAANGAVTTKNSAQTIVDLVGTSQILNSVTSQLGITTADIPAMVSISAYAAPSSGVVRVTAQSQNPELAVKAADATVTVVSTYARTVMHAEAQVVQPATSAALVDPKKDTRTSNIVLAGLVGLLVGLFIAFLRIWFNPKVFPSREISGVRPSRIFTVDYRGTSSYQQGQGYDRESINQIRTSVLLGKPGTSIVASVWPVGEISNLSSFTSQVAQSFVEAGHRPIVVSFDAAGSASDLSMVSSWKASDAAKLVTDAGRGASRLTVAFPASDVGSLALTPEFAKLVRKLSVTYSAILLELPQQARSDAALALISSSDEVVLVAQAEQTRLDLLNRHIEVLTQETSKNPIIALLSRTVESGSSAVRRK